MDPAGGTIIGSVVTALASIFGAIWQGRKAKQSQEKVATLEAAAATSARTVQQELAHRFGFSARSLSVVVEILNSEGDARLSRTYADVTLQAGTTLGHLYHFEAVYPPLAELDGETHLVRVSGPDGSRFNKQVALRYQRISNQRAESILEIPAALTSNDPPLSYVLEHKALRSYVMTSEAFADAYKNSPFPYEWHAVTPGFPIDRISLDLRFPAGYPTPQCFPGVFIGDTEFIHNQETERIKAGITRLANGASLQVEQPLLGFSYVIFWAPAPQASLTPH